MILQDFVAGTEKQIAWAETLRTKFIQLMADEDFLMEDILLVADIRLLAVWWIDNRTRLTSIAAPKIIRAAKAARTRAGSIEAAVKTQVDSLNAKIAKAEAYNKEVEEREALREEENYLEDVFEDRERPW
jgi:hypothetical protein